MLALSMACCQALAWVVVTAPPAAAQIELDLRDADLRNFVEIVSEATGRSFVLDPNVRVTVTVLAPDTLTPAELYDVFLNVLELNRLTIVQGSSVDRIVPMNVARELSSGPARTAPKGFETRVIEVNNVPLTEIIEVIRPLLPAEAVLSPVPGSNLLILSDRGQNHARIEALIRRLDTPRERPIEMVRLRNADAAEVLQVIQYMQIVPADAAVSIDRRSNALIVSGSDSLVQQIRTLASRLDTQNANVASRAIELNYADATRLADVVTRAITNEQRAETDAVVRIIPETQTNTLLISAPPEQMSDIIEMVHFLDRRPTQVLVEAVIFEMSVIGFADLSAQFGAILNDAIIGGVEFTLDGRPSLTSLVSSVLNNTTNTVPTPGNGGYFGVGARNSSGEGIVGLLSAIASTNSTRLLSTPSIMTLNNQEAEIVVAQNVPFVTGSFAQVGETAQAGQPVSDHRTPGCGPDPQGDTADQRGPHRADGDRTGSIEPDQQHVLSGGRDHGTPRSVHNRSGARRQCDHVGRTVGKWLWVRVAAGSRAQQIATCRWSVPGQERQQEPARAAGHVAPAGGQG